MNQNILSEYQIRLIEESKKNYEKLIPQIDEIQKKYTNDELIQMCEKANLIKNTYSQNLEQLIEQLNNSNLETFGQIDKYIQITRTNAEKVIAEQEIPLKIKESFKAMINIGWYPAINNFTFSSLLNFELELLESNIDEINNSFVDYYREELVAIKDEIFIKYPNRKDILQSAFEAHENGNYLLSIPAFLIQIDGISIDTFKKHFFIKKKGTNCPEILDTIEKLNFLGDFSLALLTPFQSEQPITYSEKQRGKDFNQFNRHQIMHGESLNYGTEINSYKTISLLLYIVQASEIINQEN